MNDLSIDLLRFQSELRFRYLEGQRQLFDAVRRKYLAQTPEELVRQLLVLYLVRDKGYPLGHLSVEKSIRVHGQTKRFDLLAYSPDSRPFLLAECKAPSVRLTNNTFFQAATYNIALQVPYLLITNGPVSYCCHIDHQGKNYSFLPEVPPPPVSPFRGV
ncbi:MAG: hypothetical protein RLY31_3095 [Bacteroidota bacterium]|jgi:predicted type IV restriction endonuclease